MTRVVFPCDQETWWIVKDQLHYLKNLSEQDNCDLTKLAECHQRIFNTNIGQIGKPDVSWGNCILYGLIKYLRKPSKSDEKEHFLKVMFPAIIELALKVETLLPTEGIVISEQQVEGIYALPRQLCVSIVACGFLCLFPNEQRGRGNKLNNINFNKFFSNLPLPSQNAKLQCILNFFDRVASEWERLTGSVIFIRQVLKHDEIPSLDTWLDCTAELCPVTVHTTGVIEDAGHNTIEVDFANRQIGGGTLGRGRVQEEIRFMVCPELITSMLFMETMEDNEAIVIKGYEQFSLTTGYASGLQFAGDCREQLDMDTDGNLKSTLCAIDAVSYSHGRAEKQYTDQFVLRDLNKAFTGFCVRLPAKCYTAEEEYYTADESSSDQTDYEYDPSFTLVLFAENLVANAVETAVYEAAEKIGKPAHVHHSSSSQETDAQDSSFSKSSASMASTASTDSEIPMDHLEVNFRDWLAHYRRRSSNLSDLSSRRSSYELPSSRRSSGCSTKYSSEFSSEFEEYYDNFQQQEKYKYHTIKEEVGPSVVNEFAVSLAQCVLKEGTEAFAHAKSETGVRKFHSIQPTSVMAKPAPVKKAMAESEEENTDNSESTDDDIDKVGKDENRIRKFVDDMFLEIWPFQDSKSSARSEAQRELRTSIMYLDTCDTERRLDVGRVLGNKDDKDSVCSDSDSDVGDEFDENYSDEHYLINIANDLVLKAFTEALIEYRQRYMYSGYRNINHSARSSECSSVDENEDNYSLGAGVSLGNVEGSVVAEVSEDTSATALPSTVTHDLGARPKMHDLGARPKLPNNKFAIIPLKAVCDNTVLISDKTVLTSDNTILTSDKKSVIASQEVLDETENISVEISHLSASDLSQEYSNSDNSIEHRNYSQEYSNSGYSLEHRNYSRDHSRSSRDSFDKAVDSFKHDERDVIHVTNVADMITDSSSQVLSSSPVNQNIYYNKGDSEHNKENSSPRRLSTRSILSKSPNNSSHFEKSMNICSSPKRDSITISPINILPTSSSPKSVKSGSSWSKGSRSRSNSSSHSRGTRGSKKGNSGHKRIASPANGQRSKKNYDQFANCLSRDLLTNVFLQVQDTGDGDILSLPRRSSEPMQISNGAALQRLEHSVPNVNGRRTQKSKTAEDIGTFAEELSRHGASCDVVHRKSGSGFRDPILSRFAEELIKANVSIPTFQFLNGCVSTSESSKSVCSNVSSFRDPLLAGFEDELLSSSIGKSSAHTQSSWSNKKGQLCFPGRASGNDNSDNNFPSRYAGASFDSEFSAASWLSVRSNSGATGPDDISNFADRLSRRILFEVFNVIFREDLQPSLNSSNNAGKHKRGRTSSRCCNLNEYSNKLATSILKAAMLEAENRMVCSDWLEQNKMVTWGKETECLEYSNEESDYLDSDGQGSHTDRSSTDRTSSLEYEDALDLPYQKLECFAENLASHVIVTSVSVLKREQESQLRKLYGRPVATGNWGCGAFRGDPHLKSLLQWMAASYAGTPRMIYYTFGNEKMEKFQEVVDTIITRGWSLAELMQTIRRHCITAQTQIQQTGEVSHTLFDVILHGEIYPGVS